MLNSFLALALLSNIYGVVSPIGLKQKFAEFPTIDKQLKFKEKMVPARGVEPRTY